MLRAMQVVLRGVSRRSAPAAVAGLVGQCGYSTASSSQRLAGKVAVITGAASGIGKATAAEFVRNGAKVVLADVQDDLGRALAAELGAGCRGGRPRRGPPRQAGHHAQQRRHRGLPGATRAGRARPRRLRRRHGDQHPGRDGRGEARGPRHGAAPRGQHHLHGQHRRRAGPAHAAPVQRLQVRGGGARALSGGGAGALGRARQRHLAQLHPAILTPLVKRMLEEWYPEASGEEHRRIVEGDINEMEGVVLEPGGGGHRQGGALPGIRRLQVCQRPQPRRRRRVHGGEGAQHAGTGTVKGTNLFISSALQKKTFLMNELYQFTKKIS